jgi:hypothetical protein
MFMQLQFKHYFLNASIITAIVLTSCSKDDTTPQQTDEMYTINASLNAGNENPALNTATYPGTGSVSGQYNATKNQLQYSVTWSGLSGPATLGHFHGPAAAGANAPAVISFNLINSGSSGNASGTITLTDSQESDLLAGKWYANLHTAANGGGEIRGQVTAAK